MDNPLSLLQKKYGHNAFRGQQEAIIQHVIDGHHAFVLMPTGAGKSLCYQIPALCRQGVGIVISPLIALMHDQVTSLNQLGIRAAAINSTCDAAAIQHIKQQARAGTLDLLYVAPERLLMTSFLAWLEQTTLALFAIDEAHCLSQWGHDFRPHYAELTILAERFPTVPRIALTATADQPTRYDIIQRLNLKEGQTFIAGFDRPNINYRILAKNKPKQQLIEFIQTEHAKDCGIVYCLSRKQVEETCDFLCQQGLNALSYHAGMNARIRANNQSAFLSNEQCIMVATIAFGMGIDKPDVRFVVHINIPKNIEAYYQETGRAGRDGLPANALMLYGMNDSVLLRHFIESSDADDRHKRIEQQKLNTLLGLCESVSCRRHVLLNYFGDPCTDCNNCDNCLNPPKSFDASIISQKALSCVYRTGQRFGVNYLIDVLQGKHTDRIKNFGHDNISTFGIGADLSKPAWQSYFRQLVASNMLMVAMSEHGGLKITEQGHIFLQQKPTLAMRLYEQKNTTQRAKKAKALTNYNDSDQELFNTLKDIRRQLAKERSVPPYVIFHDKTLHDFVATKPQTLAAMATINGVGDVKLVRYGTDFLSALTVESR